MASTTDFGLYIAYVLRAPASTVTNSYPSYQACVFSKFHPYCLHSSVTSASVKPKNSAISLGFAMEYSVNIASFLDTVALPMPNAAHNIIMMHFFIFFSSLWSMNFIFSPYIQLRKGKCCTKTCILGNTHKIYFMRQFTRNAGFLISYFVTSA